MLGYASSLRKVETVFVCEVCVALALVVQAVCVSACFRDDFETIESLHAEVQ